MIWSSCMLKLVLFWVFCPPPSPPSLKTKPTLHNFSIFIIVNFQLVHVIFTTLFMVCCAVCNVSKHIWIKINVHEWNCFCDEVKVQWHFNSVEYVLFISITFSSMLCLQFMFVFPFSLNVHYIYIYIYFWCFLHHYYYICVTSFKCHG